MVPGGGAGVRDRHYVMAGVNVMVGIAITLGMIGNTDGDSPLGLGCD